MGLPAPLSYFPLDAGLTRRLQSEAQLSPLEYAAVLRLAEAEQTALRLLLENSAAVISDPNLSLAQKRMAIQRSGYNRRVDFIRYASERELHQVLSAGSFARLLQWRGGAWQEEVQKHGARISILDAHPLTIPIHAPRSFEIYATRYDSKGRYTAALPDQCLKLTNGGLHTCDDHGYQVGQKYSIILSYKKSAGVDVAEAGPWNIDDNFWATLADPTPRRMFADLALGMPEAQAAFYNGYNGGLDQYGRKVTAPFAIDLAFELADDLGLPPKMNDWVTVSFMWTEGWGSGGGNGGGAAFIPIETAASGPDGEIIHTVREGQTLWAIAVSYGTTLNRLRELNGLGEDAIIIPGQKLIIHPAGATATPPALSGTDASGPEAFLTPSPLRLEGEAASPGAVKATVRPSDQAGRKTATAAVQVTRLAGYATPRPADAGQPTTLSPPGALARASAGIDPLLLMISVAAATGMALIGWGTWLKRRR